MRKFIKVNERTNNMVYRVNVDSVKYYRACKGGALIAFIDGRYIEVKETPEEIDVLIEQ